MTTTTFRRARRTARAIRAALSALAAAATLSACTHLAIDEADRQARSGDLEQSFTTLQDALRAHPDDPDVQAAWARARDRVLQRLASQAELAQATGRDAEARALLERLRALDPNHPRLRAVEAEYARREREQRQVQAARQVPPPAPPSRDLGAAFRKPVSLEFREAPLRQVFESLARTTNVNFVFDKDVKGDSRVTVFLRNVSLDEALRVILATQQLDRKLLNESTVLVYPNTPAKQREHQDLVTRSFYLANADVKNALTMVRTLAKTRDMHADERLNALVVRDTPEVVSLIERMLATIDMPEPEVMLAIEVMEVGSDRADALGISWPNLLQYGLLGSDTQTQFGQSGLRGFVANPAVTAALKGSGGSVNLLANPTIRARNHEKAKVQIGEKLPLFSTTSATANVGASTSVTLIDVGLKLDIEPSVQLDGEVTIKLALEVSNLVKEVSGPNGSLAYQLGTRLTSTSLRLRDGETQVLAGLINDEDRKSAVGLPYIARLPIVGRLFGVHSDSRTKTEIVMLITPRIVRPLATPSAADATLASGTDALPGALPLRLAPRASAGMAPGRGARPAAAPPTEGEGEAPPTDDASGATGAPAAPAPGPALVLSSSREVGPAEAISVTLANRSPSPVAGELEFDATQLRAASGGAAATNGRLPFQVEAHQEAVFVFRPLPAAAGNDVRVSVSSASANGAAVNVEGEALVRVRPRGSASP